MFVPIADAAHGNNVMLGHGSGPNNRKKRTRLALTIYHDFMLGSCIRFRVEGQ